MAAAGTKQGTGGRRQNEVSEIPDCLADGHRGDRLQPGQPDALKEEALVSRRRSAGSLGLPLPPLLPHGTAPGGAVSLARSVRVAVPSFVAEGETQALADLPLPRSCAQRRPGELH